VDLRSANHRVCAASLRQNSRHQVTMIWSPALTLNCDALRCSGPVYSNNDFSSRPGLVLLSSPATEETRREIESRHSYDRELQRQRCKNLQRD
jgi:hypothetical protein